jgi:hypothetical protein
MDIPLVRAKGTAANDPREVLLSALRGFEAAEMAGDEEAWCASLVGLAHAYADAGEEDEAIALLDRGVQRTRCDDFGESGLGMLCDMAELASSIADRRRAGGGEDPARSAREQSRSCAIEAMRQVSRVVDPQLQAAVILRAADVLETLGEDEEALVFRRSAMAQLWGSDESADDAANDERLTQSMPTLR